VKESIFNNGTKMEKKNKNEKAGELFSKLSGFSRLIWIQY
jgi:hypothetical protein